MEIDKLINFKEGDLINKIIIENKDGIVVKTIDPNVYKIISVRNEFYGSSLDKFVSRDIGVIIPIDKECIKDFGEVWVIQSVLDGKTYIYAKHVYEII